MSELNQICFLPEPGDTHAFASSVAINDKYLVVGDPGANRIVVYQKNAQGQWYRESEIYPPENSAAFKVGRGFGGNLSLDENILMVDSVIRTKPTTTYSVNSNNSKDVLRDNISAHKIVFQKHIFDLELKRQITQIDCIRNQQKESTNFYILHNGELKLITLPNNNEEMFGVSIAVHNNLILVGSPPSRKRNLEPQPGKGWLFNFNNLDSEPKVLTAEKAYFGKSVALSEQFAVVGNSGTEQLIRNSGLEPKTLIMSLDNDSFSLINNQGYLSIYKNILAIMRPRAAMQSPLLQLFKIDKYSVLSLIMERRILGSYQIIEGRYFRASTPRRCWLFGNSNPIG